MLPRYLSLCALACLLLAGCGRTERPAETAATPTTPAPAAPPAAPVPAAAEAAEAPEAAPSDESMTLLLRPGEAASPLAGQGRQAAGRVSRRAAVARFRAARDPQAATRTATGNKRWRLQSGAGLAPDTVRQAELRAFLRTGLPAGQTFTIRPGRDTLLVGAQGTQLLVPADAFDLPAGASDVRLEVQEFYTPADMVLAGLSTQAGPQLLETGGMLHLTATADGRPVALRPGRRVALRLPARRVQPDMQLFEGVAHGTRRPLDWQLPAADADSTAGGAGVARGWRRRPYGQRRPDSLAKPRLLTVWPQNAAYYNAILARLGKLVGGKSVHRSPLNGRRERAALVSLSASYHQRIARQAQLRFTIDSLGRLGSLETLPGSDPSFAAAVAGALQGAGQWQPARLPTFRRVLPVSVPTAAVGQLLVVVSRKGQVYISPQPWQVARGARPLARQLKRTNDSLLASPVFRRRYWRLQDSLAYGRMVAAQRRLLADQARLRAQFTDTSRAAITQDGVYNELQTLGLGWINCDRFAGMRDLIVYQVETGRRDAVYSLIFKDINSVVSSVESGGQAFFSNVPRGYQATVVALRRENGVTYLAQQTVRLNEQPLAALSFQPVTMAELRAALSR